MGLKPVLLGRLCIFEFTKQLFEQSIRGTFVLHFRAMTIAASNLPTRDRIVFCSQASLPCGLMLACRSRFSELFRLAALFLLPGNCLTANDTLRGLRTLQGVVTQKT